MLSCLTRLAICWFIFTVFVHWGRLKPFKCLHERYGINYTIHQTLEVNILLHLDRLLRIMTVVAHVGAKAGDLG